MEWEEAIQSLPDKKRRWQISRYRRTSKQRTELSLVDALKKVRLFNDDINKPKDVFYIVEEVR